MVGITDKIDEVIHNNGNLFLFGSIGLAILIAVVLWMYTRVDLTREPYLSQEATERQVQAHASVFRCASGKSISAWFGDESVQLTLSDGRMLSLPQAVSASGNRYANPDGSFVFWHKGVNAFIEESGTQTYRACEGPVNR